MADSKLTALTENTTPALTDLVYLVDDPSGSPLSQKIKVANLFSVLNAPQGFGLNYKIVPSVASNNLTVALKGMDGNDPSATNPVYVRIGDTVRSITSATSRAINAGTNWFTSGSAGFATKEIDYFVYLVWNAALAVPLITISRIPSARIFSDFPDGNGTAEKACYLDTTSLAAGDDCELIGRFAATLSGGVGYTWTVPTFTTVNLVQKPIYETRVLDYAPTLGWTAGTAPVNPATTWYKYKLVGNHLFVWCGGATYTAGATVTALTVTQPFSRGATTVSPLTAYIGVATANNPTQGDVGYGATFIMKCTSVAATDWWFRTDYTI